MHGQGTTPVGPDPFGRPPQLPHAYQHGQPSFHPASSITGYQHAPPNFLQPGPPASVVSGGLGSAQSYMHHHRPPHINSQTSHSHPIYEKQPLPWSRNMQQLPPAAPFQGPSAYLQPSSQGHAFGRGPSHLPPSHTPPTSFPPYQPSSSALISDSFDSSVLPIGERSSHLHPVHPPLPPPPSSSPPGVPPIPPSSPPSDIISKRDGGRNLEGLFDKNNLMIESASSLKAVEERGVHETSVPFQRSEKSGTEEGSVDAAVANSPPDSDMDMEDDITHPDAYASKCQEGQAKDQLQPSQPAGGHSLSEHGNSLLSGASVTEFEREGSKIAPLPVTMKVTSETDDLSMSENGQTEYFSDVSVEDSSTRHKSLRQPSLTEPFSRTANEKLSDQGLEGANSFKLIQGYGSDNTSENDQGNLPMNVDSCTANDGSTNFDVEKGCNFGTDLRHENQTGSNARILSESQKNDMQTDKLSALTPIIANDSGRRRRGLESVIISAVSSEPKDLRNDHDITESENLHKAVVRSSSSKLNVDEFGRLVREGISDSDTSDSSHYARRHSRRTRKRSRSRSKSQSPHNRRRRRSPWRRKERRSRSRSLSPKKRRSKSRSPGMRRDSNFGGDKLRLNRGQVAVCFDFLRGKCYRGATCRYSHHESNKSERSRYNRDKQHYRDGSRSRQSPDFREESKVILDKEMKDTDFPPGSREAKGVKRLEVDSSTDSPSVLGNLGSGSLLVTDAAASNHSHYSAHAIPSGKDKSLVLESAVQYPNEIPQSVYQQGDRTNDTPVSESSAQAISATSTDPMRNSDVKQGPIAQLSSIGAPVTKPYSTDEVSSESLKEMLPSIANHPSHVSTPLPSALQNVRASFAQPLPPISWMHTMPDNNPTYQAPVAYQHPHFHGLSKSLSSSFVPLPPPPAPPPPPPQSTGEHGISSQHMQQSKLAPWSGLSSYTSMMARPNELPYRSQTCQYQTNNLGREPDQVVHSANSFGSSNFHASNMMTQQGGPRRMLEDGLSGHPVQGINPLLPQAQPNSLMLRSPLKGTHNSVAGGLPSDGSSEYRPYFQQSSYGLQHSVAGHVPASHAEPGMFSSSTSRITPDFPETNHPSYAHNFVESRTSSYPNSYASTFDLPPSSKFSSNASIQDNNTTINTKYGALVGMSVAAVDVQKIAIDSSKNKSDLPGAGGDQYDPLFDCIEPASNMFSKADHKKYETTAELDDLVGFSGSGRVLNMEGKKQESGSSVSAHDSLENEEFGETADVAVDAVLNGTPSNPNYATDMTAGEVEIDQVKTSGKKKKNKERSMKLFKISIAAFVKEVLKPSWRQGNMSKEAFKTIVKKTVDKVSGAMKSHQIPKSQTKINHYIDSSRGKLTKLVMGYVDKYVKA